MDVFDARRPPAYSAARRAPQSAAKVESMIDSPCVKICELDRDDVCVGCGRTRAEIAGWTSMSDAQKAKVVEQAGRRLAAASRPAAARRQIIGKE